MAKKSAGPMGTQETIQFNVSCVINLCQRANVINKFDNIGPRGCKNSFMDCLLQSTRQVKTCFKDSSKKAIAFNVGLVFIITSIIIMQCFFL
jgi:hypothetical protein